MRRISLIAAAAMLISGAAEAQDRAGPGAPAAPGSAAGRGSGHAGHGSGHGWRAGAAQGWSDAHGPDAPRQGRWRGRDGFRGYGPGGYGAYGVVAYWGGGYGPSERAATAGTGFFAEGAQRAVANGRVIYDYDRGYPYEYYAARPRPAPLVETAAATDWRCSTERAVRVCRH